MNQRNYSQRSNFKAGSDAFSLLPFYLQTANVPGVNFTLPELGARGGARVMLNGDTVMFGDLSFDIILDEDLRIYKEIMNKVFNNIDVEEGTFNDFSFDFWIEMTDDMGNKVLKWEFYNCKIESVGDLNLDTMDDSTEYTMNMGLKYDYFKLVDGVDAPSLKI